MLQPLLMLVPLVQELGIPTANVDADSLRHSIAEAVTGIYCGWASVGSSSEVRA
jgi:riboflavin kinase